MPTTMAGTASNAHHQAVVLGPSEAGLASLAVTALPGFQLSLGLSQSLLGASLQAREAWREAVTALFRQQLARLEEAREDAAALSRALLAEPDVGARADLVAGYLEQTLARTLARFATVPGLLAGSAWPPDAPMAAEPLRGAAEPASARNDRAA